MINYLHNIFIKKLKANKIFCLNINYLPLHIFFIAFNFFICFIIVASKYNLFTLKLSDNMNQLQITKIDSKHLIRDKGAFKWNFFFWFTIEY